MKKPLGHVVYMIQVGASRSSVTSVKESSWKCSLDSDWFCCIKYDRPHINVDCSPLRLARPWTVSRRVHLATTWRSERLVTRLESDFGVAGRGPEGRAISHRFVYVTYTRWLDDIMKMVPSLLLYSESPQTSYRTNTRYHKITLNTVSLVFCSSSWIRATTSKMVPESKGMARQRSVDTITWSLPTLRNASGAPSYTTMCSNARLCVTYPLGDVGT